MQERTVEECLEMIVDIGSNYDGCQSLGGLKEIIDEMVEYAEQALTQF